MRQAILIEARTPREFVDIYNEELASLSRFEIVSERFISDTAMYVFYEDADELPELPKPAVKPEPCRKCAECGKFVDWRRCLEGRKGVRPDTAACERFDDDWVKYAEEEGKVEQ